MRFFKTMLFLGLLINFSMHSMELPELSRKTILELELEKKSEQLENDQEQLIKDQQDAQDPTLSAYDKLQYEKSIKVQEEGIKALLEEIKSIEEQLEEDEGEIEDVEEIEEEAIAPKSLSIREEYLKAKKEDEERKAQQRYLQNIEDLEQRKKREEAAGLRSDEGPISGKVWQAARQAVQEKYRVEKPKKSSDYESLYTQGLGILRPSQSDIQSDEDEDEFFLPSPVSTVELIDRLKDLKDELRSLLQKLSLNNQEPDDDSNDEGDEGDLDFY